MWYTFILSGDEIEDGKAFKAGEGRAGVIHSWKARQLLEKGVYLSPEIATQCEKLCVVAFQRRVVLCVRSRTGRLGVDI
jgi:hypothetical protein